MAKTRIWKETPICFTPGYLRSPRDDNETKTIQSVCGSFLYYARAVDPTILTALNEIATQQSKATLETSKKVTMLIDYIWQLTAQMPNCDSMQAQ